MLKKYSRSLIAGILIFCAATIGVVDFFMVGLIDWWFYVHNLGAFSSGISLITLSWILKRKKQGNEKINWGLMFFGIAQIAIHMVIISMGRC